MPSIERMLTLAEQVMTLSRNAVVLNLRYMDMAVFRLRPEPAEATLATDGRYLFYGPEYVLRRYMQNEALPARDYLHALLHCVFRHPFIDTLVDRYLWDLATDIAVEAMITSLELPRFEAGREAAQRPIIEALTRQLGLLTAEKLYHFFQDERPPVAWEDIFRADDHSLWHKPRQRREAGNGSQGGDEQQDSDGDDGGQRPPERQQSQDEDSQKGSMPGREPDGDNGESEAQMSQDSPGDSPPVSDEQSKALSAQASDDEEGDGSQSQKSMSAEAGGESGQSMYRKEDGGKPQSQNTGKGLDTEGGDSSTPAGSQSRNDRTRNGVESASASGTSGDSGDAATQGDSASGGSGSGLDDAQMVRDGEQSAERDDSDFFDQQETDSRSELKREWQDVSERIQMELESQAHQRGARAGNLQRQLEVGNRETYDYAAFLRKFAVLGEHMQINDDEFDQIFYTYGLNLYGNLPLIEPLETKEVKRVREFVIAIDTSASTSGALVEKFLTRTWEILSSEESFFKKIHLRIVQCDAEVQESALITCLEDFQRYMSDFTVKGLGGTDFRPVFRYVDELVRQGAFTRLKGLIYFTDGQGVYPSRKPDYETAFVFMQSPDGSAPEVPSWAIKLVLDEGDF